jgi:hypothetical protein
MMLSKKPFFIVLPVFLMLCHGFSPLLNTKQDRQQLQALPEVELKIEGLVTTDGKPCKATVEIHSNHLLHRTIITIQTDSVNGQFTTSLRAGDDYDVVVKSGRFPQQVLSVSTKNLDSTRVLPLFADFTSPVYDKKIEELKKSTSARERMPGSFNAETFRKRYGHMSARITLSIRFKLPPIVFLKILITTMSWACPTLYAKLVMIISPASPWGILKPLTRRTP